MDGPVLIVRDNRRRVHVCDKLGVNTSDAQRGQDATGNAHVLVLVVARLCEADAHAPSNVPPDPYPGLVQPGHTWTR